MEKRNENHISFVDNINIDKALERFVCVALSF